ncbi:patatin-like phospholipase family protein [Hydrogenophaga sp. MI9]|uniref:patatin-like phospholipase family protein n=1 Tax=Hydrogenophaga sp. MI9 TaxID=3453719 RepID=UPI003EEC5152
MNEKIEIQLAIQGGGARIVAIMAVLEALDELGDKISVSRIVGTSAGAIAGAIFASDVGIPSITKEWAGGRLAKLLSSFQMPKASFFMPKALSLARLLMKPQPVWDSKVIHEYLDSIFARCRLPVHTFDDLRKIKGIDVSVISTNLRNKSSEESRQNDPVVTTLIDSAGLPYLLRKWSGGGSPVIVDGGIGDNLPASRLDHSLLDVTPVCISFVPKVGANANPEDFKGFSLALLDAAIDVSSKKSATIVPNTYFVDTPISTFNFEAALEAIASGEYDRIKSDAKLWFAKLHADIISKRTQNAIAFSVTALHPWQTENAVAKALMSGVWTAIEAQFQDQLFHFHHAELRITLGGLLNEDRQDELCYSIEFEPGDDPLYCYWLGVADGVENQLTAEPDFKVTEVASGEFVRHTRIPAISPLDPSARFVAVFFTPALKKGARYRLVQTEVGRGLLNRLNSEGKDEFGVDPNRVLGSIGKVRLIIDTPEKMGHVTIKPRRTNRAAKACEYYPKDTNFPADIPTLKGFDTHVVEGENVQGLFALDIQVPK